jgi:hypothetical protein
LKQFDRLPGYLLETMKTMVKKANPAFMLTQILPLLPNLSSAPGDPGSGSANFTPPQSAPIPTATNFPAGPRCGGRDSSATAMRATN